MIAGLWKTYEEYLQSRLWEEKRDFIISLKRSCEICGSQKGLLVHHLTYEHVGNESQKDVQVVCHKCHDEIYKKKNGTD